MIQCLLANLPIHIRFLTASVTNAVLFTDTIPTSVNVELENIFNSKTPKEYIISDIKVTGTKSFDPNLIISISGLAVGDKVIFPGEIIFQERINNLWKQNLGFKCQKFILRSFKVKIYQ